MHITIGTYYFYFPRWKIFCFGLITFLIYFILCLPSKLFTSPTSTILLSEKGRLLNAHIANDGQWRFPPPDSIPYKFKSSLIAYEDHDFYQHMGVSFKGIGRALISNIKAGKVVSGGSTITMQIARMARDNDRTYWQKLIESIWALRIEWRYTKSELLRLYAAHAPFGGNVVGLGAASWRYYGVPPYQLSWSQCATLAVLPNAPGLVYPGKNRKLLKEKRNRVLKRLHKIGKIDAITYELALDEPVIGAPKDLPNLAGNLMADAIKNGKKGQRITTTLNYYKQTAFSKILAAHQAILNQKNINNAALIVVDLHHNKVITYIGNSAKEDIHQKYVDCARSPRSTGSILKPFLYASLIQEGSITNSMLVPDIPMHFSHFTPQNYTKKNDGAVPAGEALSRSLNIPAVYLLKKYGISRFLYKLHQIGQKHINKSANYYGLSLILGGAETTLWDLANSYAGMAKTLNYYNQTNAYNPNTWNKIHVYHPLHTKKGKDTRTTPILDAGGIYETFKALLNVHRPRMESSWRDYASSTKIAWKTGTSFGNRDAWSVGCTPDYVVAVWVGNATGEGKPFVIGATAAAPIMFDVFSHLNKKTAWFIPPYDELTKVSICKKSGYLSGSLCTETDSVYVHQNAIRSPACSFHQVILTDRNEQYRYYQNCSQNQQLHRDTFFVLPPSEAYYYQKNHANYHRIPPISPNCSNLGEQSTFRIVYPEQNSELVGTKGLDGKKQGIIFKASAPDPKTILFWHVDQRYLGETVGEHSIKYFPKKGKHLLTVVDQNGNMKKIWFTILD